MVDWKKKREWVYDKGAILFIVGLFLVLLAGWANDYRICNNNPNDAACSCTLRGPVTKYEVYNIVSATGVVQCSATNTSCENMSKTDQTMYWQNGSTAYLAHGFNGEAPGVEQHQIKPVPGYCLKASPRRGRADD